MKTKAQEEIPLEELVENFKISFAGKYGDSEIK
jgi:hypothetical protein